MSELITIKSSINLKTNPATIVISYKNLKIAVSGFGNDKQIIISGPNISSKLTREIISIISEEELKLKILKGNSHSLYRICEDLN